MSKSQSDTAFEIDSVRGLTSDEAKERLAKYGPNAIEEKEESWGHRLFRRFWGPIPWMIEVATILSAIAQRWEDFTVITLLTFCQCLLLIFIKNPKP